MNRLTHHCFALAAAALLALTAAGTAAAKNVTTDVSLVSGTQGQSYTGAETITHEEVGSFLDTFRLHLPGTASVEATVITIGGSDDQFITFNNVWLNGVQVPLTMQDSGGMHSGYGVLNLSGLSGDVLLTVEGYAGGLLPLGSSIAASYSGNFNVIASAVPEPQGAALMLAGLGAVGVVLRRRRRA